MKKPVDRASQKPVDRPVNRRWFWNLPVGSGRENPDRFHLWFEPSQLLPLTKAQYLFIYWWTQKRLGQQYRGINTTTHQSHPNTHKALSKIESNRLFLRYQYMVQARYSGASSQNNYCMDRTLSHLILLAQITTRCTSIDTSKHEICCVLSDQSMKSRHIILDQRSRHTCASRKIKHYPVSIVVTYS